MELIFEDIYKIMFYKSGEEKSRRIWRLELLFYANQRV